VWYSKKLEKFKKHFKASPTQVRWYLKIEEKVSPKRNLAFGRNMCQN